MRCFSNLEVEGWAVMSCLANGTHHTTNRGKIELLLSNKVIDISLIDF